MTLLCILNDFKCIPRCEHKIPKPSYWYQYKKLLSNNRSIEQDRMLYNIQSHRIILKTDKVQQIILKIGEENIKNADIELLLWLCIFRQFEGIRN